MMMMIKIANDSSTLKAVEQALKLVYSFLYLFNFYYLLEAIKLFSPSVFVQECVVEHKINGYSILEYENLHSAVQI